MMQLYDFCVQRNDWSENTFKAVLKNMLSDRCLIWIKPYPISLLKKLPLSNSDRFKNEHHHPRSEHIFIKMFRASWISLSTE